MSNLKIRRGDIFFVDLNGSTGSEQGGKRPCIVIQNDTGNKFSPTVIVAAITSMKTKKPIPTHISISPIETYFDNTRFKQKGIGQLEKDSIILFEQLRTVDKKRLTSVLGSCEGYIGTVTHEKLREVDRGLILSLGIGQESFQI